MIRSTRGCATFMEAEYSVVERLEGFSRPRPPKRAGRASSSLSRSEGAARPVSEGINLVLSNSSSGCKRWPMLGIVLAA